MRKTTAITDELRHHGQQHKGTELGKLLQWAALHGISQGKVSAIRRHRCWRDLAGNPFTGLGARA